MKRIAVAVLSVLMMCLFCVASYAVEYDIDYNGVLGANYSVSDDENADGSDNSDNRVTISNNVSYQSDEGLYYIYCSDIKQPFTSNVVDGMVSQQPVNITVPNGVSCQLYLDGALSTEDLSMITQPGSYVLNLKTNSGAIEKVLSFYIVSEYCGFLTSYNMPSGFMIDTVIIDGEEMTNNGSSVDFQKEGKYEIKYVCSNTDRYYNLTVNIDHTAPTLALEAVKDGKAWGQVDVSDLEAGATLYVYREGYLEEITDGIITKSGKYELLVKDAAGNTSSYQFTIMIYFDAASIAFVLIFVVIVAAVAAFVIYSRKKMRIR